MRNMLVVALWVFAAALLIAKPSVAQGTGRKLAPGLPQPLILSPGSMLSGVGGKFEGAMEMQAAASGASASPPQALGPKASGKSRICVALPRAQVGQGNSAQSNYGIPIRNAIISTMSGPLLEVAALDASLPLQVQAEAQQKECDYIVFSAVTVKHSGGGLGKFIKAGNTASSFTSIGMVTYTVPSTNGTIVVEEAAYAIEHTTSQLSGFNGRIKSKDEVTFTYQLFATGQSQPKLENSLKGKSKSDGEDVLSPLMQQAANGILADVTKK